MKNTIIAWGLALTTVTSFAATQATLNLKGNVPNVMSIALVAESVALTLPLQTTQTNTKVAVVTEVSNSSTGYKITAQSTNLGKLKHANGNTFNYSLFYAGTNLNLQNSSPSPIVNTSTTAVNRTRDVTISYTGVPADQLIAGDYTDQVTFTIAAN
jgi:hypothetical protein